MQKILQRPICHLNFQQANLIFDEIRLHQIFSHPQPPSLINRQKEISSIYHNAFTPQIQTTSNNNQSQEKRNSQQQPGLRMNRLNSLPENHQHINSQQNQALNFHSPITPQHHQNFTQQNGQRIISKDSIIRKYDDVFGQKLNLQQLREQNSRLYYQKLAFQASMQRLKEESAKKDIQISKLKEFIQQSNIQNVGNANSNKNPQIQLPAQKPLHGFSSQVVNQGNSPQIHFRSNYQQKRPF